MRFYKLTRDISLGGGMSWKEGDLVREVPIRTFRTGVRIAGRSAHQAKIRVTKSVDKNSPYAELTLADLVPIEPPAPSPPPPPAELVADESWGAF